MTPAERIESYAESPGAFRRRLRGSSWLTALLVLAAVAAIAWAFGDLHLALKGVLAVIALSAALPLLRDFRRAQCTLCGRPAEEITVRKPTGEQEVRLACHHCRVFKVL